MIYVTRSTSLSDLISRIESIQNTHINQELDRTPDQVAIFGSLLNLFFSIFFSLQILIASRSFKLISSSKSRDQQKHAHRAELFILNSNIDNSRLC